MSHPLIVECLPCIERTVFAGHFPPRPISPVRNPAFTIDGGRLTLAWFPEVPPLVAVAQVAQAEEVARLLAPQFGRQPVG